MAELFLARALGPEGFEKLVVLKKILPSFATNPRFVQLFLDEAKLGASLDHPHIAQVHDMGMVEGSYFFTMEYLHGQDVRSILRRCVHDAKHCPIDYAVQIARNVASALHYAHERRGPDGKLLDIVHRDVSPSNVIVSYDGAVKLLDFGVAKATTSSVKTRTGTLKGKVAYMSPEQARGQPLDRRSDIYSLGIVLWEMFATRRLFKADNDLATIQMIINDPPPKLCELRPECPAELERIAERALSKDPAARYQTAQELQLDLDELARESKLKQSSVALSAFMNTLFASEIDAWKDAQAKGVTLTDHLSVVGSHVGDATAAVSEGMLEFESSEDEVDSPDELDDGAFGAMPPPAAPSPTPFKLPGVPPIRVPAVVPPISTTSTQAGVAAPVRTPPVGMPVVRVATPLPVEMETETTDVSPPPVLAEPAPAPPIAPPMAMPAMPAVAIDAFALAPTPPVGVPVQIAIAPASAWDPAETTDQLARNRSRRAWVITGTAFAVALTAILIFGFTRSKSKPEATPDRAAKTITPAPSPSPSPKDEEPASKAEAKTEEPTPEPARIAPAAVKKAAREPVAKTPPRKQPPPPRKQPPPPRKLPAKKPVKPFDPDAPLPPS